MEEAIGKRTRKILEALAECIIPSGGSEYPGAKDLRLIDLFTERFSRRPRVLLALKILAWCWELAPLLFFRFQLFTWMSEEKQTVFLEGWEKSRLMLRRWAILGTKAVFLAAFYNQRLVWEKIGYEPGRCFRTVSGGERK